MKLFRKTIFALLALAAVAGTPSCQKSVFVPQNPVNPEPPDDPGVYEEGFYVTVKGAGRFTGEDWDNAMSAQNLKDLLLADDGGAFPADKAAKINGKIIHLEQGIYPFGSAEMPLPLISGETAAFSVTLKGGYKNGGYTQYPQKYHTYLSGASDYRIFQIKGNAKVTLDGVGLTGSRGEGGGQAAVSVKGAGAELVLNSCDICNNYNSATVGGVQITDGAIVRATGCRFFNNVAGYAGALNVDGAASCCYLTDCQFYNNSANNQGGAIKVTTGTLNVTDCFFKNNHAEDRGGAVWVNGCKDANSVVFERCRFVGNSSTSGGGTCWHNGSSKAIYKACEFTDNAGSTGGLIAVGGSSGPVVGFDHCVITGCYSISSYSSVLQIPTNDSGRIYFNACLFKDNSSHGKYGTEGALNMKDPSKSFVGMNNCAVSSSSLDLEGANSQQASWYNLGACKFLFANCSIIGVPTAAGIGLPSYGLVRLNNNNANVGLINNIIVSTHSKGCGIYGGDTQTALTLTGSFNKMSPVRSQTTGTFTYTPGEGDDLTAYDSSFPELEWGEFGWTWSGAYSGTAPYGSTVAINAAIQTFDADFYAWLNSIGALGKDIRGNDRGTTSWPGSYQN